METLLSAITNPPNNNREKIKDILEEYRNNHDLDLDKCVAEVIELAVAVHQDDYWKHQNAGAPDCFDR